MHYVRTDVPLVQVSHDDYEEPVYHYAGSAKIHDCVSKDRYSHSVSAWSHKPFVIVATFTNGDLCVYRSQPMPWVKTTI